MPTYAWVAIGMLTAGIGGALATWASMFVMYRGLEPQPPEVLGNLTALGGVFAGICGGLASLSRGQKANHKDFKGGLAAIGLGLGVIAVINFGFLLSPFLLVVAPLQGLAALLGGFAALSVLWVALSLAGIRDESDLAIPFSGSAPTPLSKIGLIAIALGCVLPLFPYFKDWLEIISTLLFMGGLLLYSLARLARVASRLLKSGGDVVEPSNAADSR